MKPLKKNERFTVWACYGGYVTQAVVNNISPLFFALYQRSLGISLGQISLLIGTNFGFQILIDLAAARYADRLGYRRCMVAAHLSAVGGLLAIGLLAPTASHPMGVLLAATLLNAAGGGLLEVLVSPIVEATPSREKDKAMSLLHSFYCWGCVAFIALSTLLLRLMGEERWGWIPCLWALMPLFNGLLFTQVPIGKLAAEDETKPVQRLSRQQIFWLLAAVMICAGAAEQSMSQWASYFAEMALGVSKTLGDLLGPCAFGVLMGAGRAFYGAGGHRLRLEPALISSGMLCVASYLLAVFAPHPLLGLLGCGLCGLSVALMWPGAISLAASACPSGGTAMFALLALAGDLGCFSGPQLVGLVSEAVPELGLRAGLLAAIVFPLGLTVAVGGNLWKKASPLKKFQKRSCKEGAMVPAHSHE